jgi:hypothetical protein
MNDSLLKYAYIQYAADIPHESIIQTLISNGASPSEAQHILDIATISYCTKSGQVSQQQSAPVEEETDLWGIIKIVLSIGGLILSVVKCMS